MCKLQGLRVALTRPVGQGEALAARIRAAGGDVVALPLLDIAPPSQSVVPQDLYVQIARAAWVIFISPNAVVRVLQILPAQDWPSRPKLAAIGQGTARTLLAAGFEQVLAPREGADSEALLALPEFQSLGGQGVLLVRGEGGRTVLAQTLGARGAKIEHAPVYRRVALPPDMAVLRAGKPLIFVITSSEALRVLLGAARDADDAEWLRAQDFVLAHPRIAAQAKTFGLNHGIIAKTPDDAAVFTALLHYAHRKGDAS